MAKFKDNDGGEWLIQLDAPTIDDIRGEHQVDLIDLDGATWARMESDLVLRVNVIWSLCAEQAADRIDTIPDPDWKPPADDLTAERPTKQVRGVTPKRFARLLVGHGLANATEALVQAVEDFFPPERRSLLRALMAKQRQVTEMGVREALEVMDNPNLDERTRQAMRRKMETTLDENLTQLERPTNSPDSAESPPAG